MTAPLTTRMLPAGAEAIAEAVRVLKAGGLVAFPTETVYGLGADAGNGEAIARLYAAKGRPAFNPLIAHVDGLSAARKLARFDAAAERLAAAFWPGPLTLVLSKAPGCPVAELATASLDSIAVRVPVHPVALGILRGFNGALVAPSANRSGHVSPTTPAHVLADLGGRIDLIIDGGAARAGIESTIVARLGATVLLRPGAVPRKAIEHVLQEKLQEKLHEAPDAGDTSGAPLAPGMLKSHYAPRTPLRLDVSRVEPGEALLAFGPALAEGVDRTTKVLNLSALSDLSTAASNLFSHLRALDASGARAIAVMPIPHEGLGEAINDRLRRAAAPR